MYTESDIYVRDQLLIQFMMCFVDDRNKSTVEDFYEGWLNWLKTMEENH